jgi:hypothetical protein
MSERQVKDVKAAPYGAELKFPDAAVARDFMTWVQRRDFYVWQPEGDFRRVRFLTGVTGHGAQSLRREWAAARGREKQEEVETRPKPTGVLLCGALLLALVLGPVARPAEATPGAPVVIKRPADPGYRAKLDALKLQMRRLRGQELAHFTQARRQKGWPAARSLALGLTENDLERLARGQTLEWDARRKGAAVRRALQEWDQARGPGATRTYRHLGFDRQGKSILGEPLSVPGQRDWVYFLLVPNRDAPGEVELLVQMATRRRLHPRMRMAAWGPGVQLFHGDKPVEPLPPHPPTTPTP